VNELSDTEQIVIFAYTKFDIDYEREDAGEPKLTDEQWEKFRHWMNKYVDMWDDYNDALYYATKEK
jgi:hypothetical protein